MENKEFTTFEEQIKILKIRELKFGSEETAINALKRYGYYSVINGYKDPYVEIVDGEEQYKDGVTFEQLFSLYSLDRDIRNTIMKTMLEVEDNLKSATAHVIAEDFTSNTNVYLARENYRPGRKRKDKYQIDELLNKFNKILTDSTDPVKYYQENYNNVPPWILFKQASFGNMVNFIKLQRGPQKNKIISLLYNIPVEIIEQYSDLKDFFMDTLFVCLDYRNRAAHGGRMYNFKSKPTFRYQKFFHPSLNITPEDYRKGSGRTGIPILLKALNLWDNEHLSIISTTGIEFYCKEHCKNYQSDMEFLMDFLFINKDSDNSPATY